MQSLSTSFIRVLLALLIPSSAMLSQEWTPEPQHRFSYRQLWEGYRTANPADTRLVAVRGNMKTLLPIIKKSGKLHTSTRTVATATLPISTILELAQLQQTSTIDEGWTQLPPFLRSIWGTIDDSNRVSYTPLLPAAISSTAIEPAVTEAGMRDAWLVRKPLTQRYDGTGVVVGIIENGLVDFRHPDFQNSDGTTRFAAVWDQTKTLLPAPNHFGYGMVWTPSTINKEIRGEQALFNEDPRASSHCTAVAGVAAGNGYGLGRHAGVAPNSTLVYVDILPSSPNLIDAARFIYNIADSLGLPCVIVISYQVDQRICDGSNLASTALSDMVTEKPGRACVVAAGNNGHWRSHIAYQGEGNNPREFWLGTTGPYTKYHHFARINRSDMSKLRIGVGAVVADTVSVSRVVEPQASRTLQEMVAATSAHPYLLIANNDTLFKLTIHPWLLSDTSVLLDCIIERGPATTKGRKPLLTISLSGHGKYEGWNEFFLLAAGRNWAYDEFPLPSTLLQPDSLHTIYPPGDGDHIFSAGAFWNRTEFLTEADTIYQMSDDDGISYSGRLMKTTAIGGIRNGIVRPTILAPGHGIVAPIPLQRHRRFDDWPRLAGGLHSAFSGTSAAAPVLAGAIALFLQKNPTATYETIRKALIETATTDRETNTIPNPRAGYGKLNIFQLLCWEPKKK